MVSSTCPRSCRKPVTVRVYAELADGSWHLGSVARFAETDHEFLKQAYGRFSPLAFWRAWRALVGRDAGGGLASAERTQRRDPPGVAASIPPRLRAGRSAPPPRWLPAPRAQRSPGCACI
ncbi:MAG: hypothetical protein WDM96_02825 [Lacunisphaera sp.]